MRTIINFFMLVVFLSSCEVNRTNAEEDKLDAKKIAEDFYSTILRDQRTSLDRLYGDGVTPTEVNRTFYVLDSICGRLQSYNIEEIRTDVTTKGDRRTGEYLIIVSCNYDSAITKEELYITLKDTGYVISGYQSEMSLN